MPRDEKRNDGPDPEHMRSLLQQHLVASANGEARIVDCRIANLRHRDGSRGTVQFDIRVEDLRSGAVHDHTVTGVTYGEQRTRRAWDAIRAERPVLLTASETLALLPFGFVPELDMLLQVFPHDHRIPALATLMQGVPSAMESAVIAQFGPGAWQLRDWRPETVQYRAGMRAVVRLHIGAVDAATGQEADHVLYAKLYRDANQAERLWNTQVDLYERARAAGVNLALARPITYDRELQAIVTEEVSGQSLASALRQGHDVSEAIRATAHVLAFLHSLPGPLPPCRTGEDITRMKEAAQILTDTHPGLGPTVSSIADQVIAGLENAPCTLIHGDLKPAHVIIDGDRVSLIDFDLMGAADPVVDGAHLVSFRGDNRERSQITDVNVDGATRLFLDEYFSLVPDTWRGRLPIHHAMTSLHRAVGLSRKRGSSGIDHVQVILDEAQAFLSGCLDDGVAPSFKRRITRQSS